MHVHVCSISAVFKHQILLRTKVSLLSNSKFGWILVTNRQVCLYVKQYAGHVCYSSENDKATVFSLVRVQQARAPGKRQWSFLSLLFLPLNSHYPPPHPTITPFWGFPGLENTPHARTSVTASFVCVCVCVCVCLCFFGGGGLIGTWVLYVFPLGTSPL